LLFEETVVTAMAASFRGWTAAVRATKNPP
jgi:hypothetical protein